MLDQENLKVSIMPKLSPEIITDQISVDEKKIFSMNLGNSKTRTKEQLNVANYEFRQFFESVPNNSFLVFSDGSVAGDNCFGEGGCGMILVKKGENSQDTKESKKVGRKVDNVRCEIEGVVAALDMLVKKCRTDEGSKICYILTDCKSAVDVLVGQNDAHKRVTVFRKVWMLLRLLKDMGQKIEIMWVPGHAKLYFNEVADKLAKEGSKLSLEVT